MGLFLRVAGPSVFLSSRHGYVRELLELYQGPFQCSRRTVEFLSRCCCGKRPHLALRGESPGFSQVAAGSLAFLSSYYGDLSDPLVFPQESQVSMQVERGLSGFIIIQVLGPRSSSGVEAGTSGFLSSADMDLGVPLEFQQGSQASSLVVTWKSAFLLSYKSSFKVPVELT